MYTPWWRFPLAAIGAAPQDEKYSSGGAEEKICRCKRIFKWDIKRLLLHGEKGTGPLLHMQNVVALNTWAIHLQVLGRPPHLSRSGAEQGGRFKFVLSDQLRSLPQLLPAMHFISVGDCSSPLAHLCIYMRISFGGQIIDNLKHILAIVQEGRKFIILTAKRPLV